MIKTGFTFIIQYMFINSIYYILKIIQELQLYSMNTVDNI